MEALEQRVLLSAIVDDRDAGFSTVGTWGFTVETGNYYLNDHSFAKGSAGASIATYQFNTLVPGVYRISATWRGDTNRATNSPFSIYDGSNLLATERLNQQLQPSGVSENGFNFTDIGTTWQISGTSAKVTLSDDANGYVDADAVRLERVGELPAPSPLMIVSLNGAALTSGSSVLDFGTTPSGNAVSRTLTVTNIGPLPLHLGAVTLPTGLTAVGGFSNTVLSTGGSSTLVVTAPALFPGPLTGTLSFTSDDPNQATFGLTVSGTVNAVPTPLLPGFQDTLLAANLGSTTAMAVAPDGRIFISDQAGILRIVQNGAQLPTPFVSIPVSDAGERGMLGVAFDPDFQNNHYVYVFYSHPDGYNRISRFIADGNVAVPGSETLLFATPQVGFIHNGGSMAFGPDGKLYVGIGDSSQPANAQSLNTIFGKVLRLNADGSIPTDNPFYNTTTGINRAIYALGFRNPFTFNFQPGTGRMFVDDVGQDSWEEINDVVAGGNYGWPNYEGPSNDPAFRAPLYAYQHFNGAQAITGGAFYNPATTQFPSSYTGSYIFTDLGAGWVHVLQPATGVVTDFAIGLKLPVGLITQSDGSLLYLERGANGQSGELHRITFPGFLTAPVVTLPPASQIAAIGGSVTFSVTATGTAPLTYQWLRNNQVIPGATGATYTLPTVLGTDQGAQFKVTVSNGQGSITTDPAVLTAINHAAPTASITAPAPGVLYQGGQDVTFSGAATDAFGNPLPDSAFTWRVDWFTGAVARPNLQPTSGIHTGTFTIPAQVPYPLADVFYRITLTVIDSDGLTRTVVRDMLPQVSTITITSNLPAVALTLDGQTHTGPYSTAGVAGNLRSIGAPATVLANGQLYTFTGWSDGGAVLHDITTPLSDTIYTAIYAAGTVQYIDDRDAGYSRVGTWGSSVELGRYYGDDHSYAIGGAGADVSSYTFVGLSPGKYRVSATWRGDTNRATNAPFTILDGTTPLATVRINQKNAPGSLNDQGFAWGDIGVSYNISSGTLVVRLSDDADQYVDADAIRIERLGDLEAGPEIVLQNAGVTVATGSTLDFGAVTVGSPVVKTLTISNIGTTALLINGLGAMPAGFSLVSGPASSNLAPGTSTTFVVRMDAAGAGTFGGALSILSNDADEGTFVVNLTGSAAAPPTYIIVDDRDAGYSNIGTWGSTVELGRYYGDDHSFAIGGGGANVSIYTFTGLTPGMYRVSATWRGDTNRATNSPFTIYDDGTALATIRINQQQAPSTFTKLGLGWGDIGAPVAITSGKLVLRLSDDANQYVDADAIMIDRVGELPTGPGMQVLDGAAGLTSGTSVVNFGSTAPGSPAQKTFTVRNVGSSPITLGAFDALPSGFSLAAGFGSTTLTPGASTTFVLQLDAAAVGIYSGTVSFATSGGGVSSFSFGVAGAVAVPPPPALVKIIDDRDAGYAKIGTWGSSVEVGRYFGDDHSFAIGGGGSDVATYTFTGLPTGQYRVSATWRGDTNRATNAPFTVLDGNLELATVRINQELAPASRTDQGSSFGDIGVYDVSSGTLVVRLSDDANEYVDADAVRIERIGELGAPPVVQPVTVFYADDRDAGWASTGAWGTTSESVYYGGDHSFAIGGHGANVATWTFTGLTAGQYRVSITWRGDTNRATNSPFTVLDGTNALGTVIVNQQAAPASRLDKGIAWGDIGVFTITGNTLTVRLTDDANQYVDADAIRIERIG